MVSSSSSVTRCLKRLEKEKTDILISHKDDLLLEAENDRKWYVTFKGANGSLYEGETFKLQFRFGDNYVSI